MATAAHKSTKKNRNTFFCHLTRVLYFPDRVKMPVSMIRMAGKSCRGIERQMATEYRVCTIDTMGSFEGKLSKITVCTLSPNAMYDMAPTDVKRIVINTMVPVRTFGNLCGSFIDSVIGMTAGVE